MRGIGMVVNLWRAALAACAAAAVISLAASAASAQPCRGTLEEVVDCLNRKLAFVQLSTGPDGRAVLVLRGSSVVIQFPKGGEEVEQRASVQAPPQQLLREWPDEDGMYPEEPVTYQDDGRQQQQQRQRVRHEQPPRNWQPRQAPRQQRPDGHSTNEQLQPAPPARQWRPAESSEPHARATEQRPLPPVSAPEPY